MTIDPPAPDRALTKSSVGVSGSASDETRELLVPFATTIREALARGERDAELFDGRDFDPGFWQVASTALDGLDARAAKAALAEELEVRLVGLSADVSRLTERIQSMHEALRKESVRSELAFRERDEERARVAVLREALEAVVDFEPGSMRDFNAVGAIRQIAADALVASLRDAGEAGA